MAVSKRPTNKTNLPSDDLLGELILTKENFHQTITQALNWYNSNWDDVDYRKAAEKYIEHINAPEYKFAIDKGSISQIRTIGALGRIITKGFYLQDDYHDRLCARLIKLKQLYPVPVKATPVVSPTIAQRIEESASNHLAEIDEAIDEFTTKQTPFSTKQYLVANSVSAPVTKKISEFYQKLVDELNEALEGKCEQLKEAYSRLSKKALKNYRDFVQMIVDDCSQQVVSAKANRKVRTRKPKPPAFVARKIKYKRECDQLKLKSIEPAKIIGSSELWLFDTKSRKLTVYYGTGGYLGVAGTAVTNYDVTKSASKIVRKPEEFFKGLPSLGKRALTNAFKTIKSKDTKPRGRINKDTVLLTAA